jgi:hypothetical protein
MGTDRMALLTRLEQAASSSQPDVVREALGWAIEELMAAEVTQRLGAGPPRADRPSARARATVTAQRLFDSRAGAIELAIPKLRTGSSPVDSSTIHLASWLRSRALGWPLRHGVSVRLSGRTADRNGRST